MVSKDEVARFSENEIGMNIIDNKYKYAQHIRKSKTDSCNQSQ